VVIDVLRASTTIVTALQAGAAAIHVFGDVEQLFATSERFPAPERIRGGERGGQKLAEFDLGNSPLDYTQTQVANRQVFLTTTNGTRCLEAVQNAAQVLVGALINRQAVAEYLIHTQPQQVWLVGSGWEGAYSLEDTVCAGAIAEAIVTQTQTALGDIAGNDELVAAVSLYRQWQEQLLALLKISSHGQRLLRLNAQDDLAYCAKLDLVDLLPRQKEPGVLVAR
jgi:2-phosphosulfolactate phosphatase